MVNILLPLLSYNSRYIVCVKKTTTTTTSKVSVQVWLEILNDHLHARHSSQRNPVPQHTQAITIKAQIWAGTANFHILGFKEFGWTTVLQFDRSSTFSLSLQLLSLPVECHDISHLMGNDQVLTLNQLSKLVQVAPS